ncbi:hypothetical protein TNCV_223751 [Trichonephila clavipes]|nr:hypothetical protein TNCV_223751 [Trichonephila clavipes]
MTVLTCPKPIPKVNLVPRPKHNPAFFGVHLITKEENARTRLSSRLIVTCTGTNEKENDLLKCSRRQSAHATVDLEARFASLHFGVPFETSVTYKPIL